MSRKSFVESLGATCDNWVWSWSFVNHDERFVIFGAWVDLTGQDSALVFSEKWRFNSRGHANAGWAPSREHIRLVEEEGYQIQTFPQIPQEEGGEPAKIKEIIERLTPKTLKRVGSQWYASDEGTLPPLPEQIVSQGGCFEGAMVQVSVNAFERDAKARAKCIAHYGYRCSVCDLDFERCYGSLGSRFIHVHHLTPLSEIRQTYELNPIRDLRPICPNCHAMIHRVRPALSLDDLRDLIQQGFQ